MTNILTIFRKDLRHLWPQAAATVILMALSAILDPTYGNRSSSFSYGLLVGFALPLACWNLIVAAIHEEKLPGDRQYWITRPYAWKELLAAKALFVAAFINLPLLVWHVAALTAVGIPLGEHLPALLWRQLFFSAFYILPVAALAAITRSLGQVILIGLVLGLPVARSGTFLLAQNVEGILATATAAILIAGVLAVLVVQYSRRATKLSRWLAGSAVAAIVIVSMAVGKLSGGGRTHAEDSPIRFWLDGAGGRQSTLLASGRRDIVTLDIPVRVEGIPAGVDLVQNEITVRIDGSGGRTWRPTARMDGGFHDLAAGTAWLTLFVERNALRNLGPSPANVRGIASFVVFGHRQILPLPHGHPVVVPKVGVCVDTRDRSGSISLVCYTPDPRASVTIGTTRSRLNWIIPHGLVETSIPTSADFQPLMKFSSLLTYRSWEEIGTTQLVVADPLPAAHIRFDFPEVDLSAYAVGNKE